MSAKSAKAKKVVTLITVVVVFATFSIIRMLPTPTEADDMYKIYLPLISGASLPSPPPLESGVAVFIPYPNPEDYLAEMSAAGAWNTKEIAAHTPNGDFLTPKIAPAGDHVQPLGIKSIPIVDEHLNTGEGWGIFGEGWFENSHAHLGPGATLAQWIVAPNITNDLLQLYAYALLGGGKAKISLYSQGQYCSQGYQGNGQPGIYTVLDTLECRGKLNPGEELVAVIENVGNQTIMVDVVFGDWWDPTYGPPPSPGSWYGTYHLPGDDRICLYDSPSDTDPVCTTRFGAYIAGVDQPHPTGNRVTAMKYKNYLLAERLGRHVGLAAPLRSPPAQGPETLVAVLVTYELYELATAAGLAIPLSIDGEEVLLATEDIFGSPTEWWNRLDQGTCDAGSRLCAYKALVQLGNLWIGAWVTDGVLAQMIEQVEPLGGTWEANAWWGEVEGVVVQSLEGRINTDGILNAGGGPRQDDSIEIWAGVKNNVATIAIAHIVHGQVEFLAFQVPVTATSFPGSESLGGWYYNPADLILSSAKVARKVRSSISGAELPLTVQQGGYARWVMFRNKYCSIQVARIRFGG